MEWLLAASAIAGLIRAGANAWGAVEKQKAKKQELKDSRDQLYAYYNNGEDGGAEGYYRKWANAEVADKNEQIQTQINQTAAAQEISRKQAGQNIAAQDIIANAQIAELQVQAKEAEGSAIQSAATSGFRGSADLTGTIGAAVRRTRSAGARTIEQAQLQARASRMQSYQSALNNYTSAEMQKALYSQQQQMNERALTRTLEQLEKEYYYKDESLKADQEFLDKYGWLSYLGVGFDFLGSAADYGSQAYTHIKNATTPKATTSAS